MRFPSRNSIQGMPAPARRHRRFGVGVLLCLLVLRACLPPGFMPSASAMQEGRVEIVICTGTGYQSLFVDQSGAPIGEPEADKSDGAATGCAFGMVLPMALLQSPLGWQIAAPLPSDDVFSLRDPSYVTPSPRGPPVGGRAPPYRLG